MARSKAAPCTSCGAPLGGREGCQAQFDRLSAKAWETPVRAVVHNMVVDTYAMQHPEDYCVSAKSYAAHLTGLCCGLEHPGDHKLYWQIPRWLDGPSTLVKPPVLDVRGRKTIITIADVADGAYQSAVRQWAAAVWAAYESQQYLARGWLADVVHHSNRRSRDQKE